MSSRALALTTIATLLLIAGFASPVYAHANLFRSDPPANSVLPSSPHQVTLYFTEQLEPKLSGAAVYDSTGKEVDTGYSVSLTDATILIVSLPSLPSGVYTVAWHAISAIDGHHTSGSFSFGIGNVAIPVQQNNNATAYTFPSALEVGERWLNLLSDAIFVGGGFFAILVWIPTISTNRSEDLDAYTRKVISHFSRLLTLSVILGVGATLLLLFVEAIAAAGSNSVATVALTVYTILSSTRLGEYWILRFATVIAALAASIIVTRATRGSKRVWIPVLVIGIILSLSTSLTSHNAAATNYNPAINLLSDWIHVTAVGAWVGGLAYFAVALYPINGLKESKGRLIVGLLRRFSSVAVTCVGVIGITGIYNLAIEVGSLTALYTTPYGQILLIKLAIFAPMIAFGAFNQLVLYNKIGGRTSRATRTNPQKTTRPLGRFKLTIRSELTLGVILLLVVGLLTASAPVAQTPSTPPRYQPAPFILRGYSDQGVNVTVKIFPFQVGDNHFEIDFTGPQGTPVTNVRSVFVKFKYLERNVGVSQANATASSNAGVYSLEGTYLSFSGKWQAEIWAQRSGAFDIIVPFQFIVPLLSLRFSELALPGNANPYGIVSDKNGVIWFAESGSGNVGRYEPTTGTFSEFPLPRAGSRPFYLTVDNNGSVWASETQYNQIVQFEPTTSTFKQYSIPTSGAVPGDIAADKNGNIWFTEEIGDKIGRLNPLTGNITEFQIPTTDAIPIQTTIDANGSVWFTESKGGKIGMVNPQNGMISEFQPAGNMTLLGPTGITTAPDGSIWFSEHAGNRITQFVPTNQSFQSYPIPTNQAFPFGITYHDHKIWFVEHIANAIGSLDLSTHTFSNFPVPNNSSDVQLLTVDQAGNVWFTLPASNILGALTPTTSALQLVSNSNNNSDFVELALIAAVVVGSATVAALVLGQRRMKRKSRTRNAMG